MNHRALIATLRIFVVAVSLLGFAACNNMESDGVGTAAVVVSNAFASTAPELPVTRQAGFTPIDPSEIESLQVTIREVFLRRTSSDAPPETRQAATREVSVSNNEFQPYVIGAAPGDSVRWTWTENGNHNVTSGTVAGSTPDFMGSGTTTGDTVTVAFPTADVAPYFSNMTADIDDGMSGVVQVAAGMLPPSTTAPTEQRITSGAVVIDLFGIDPLTEVLGALSIPVGSFSGIRLVVDTPRLVLSADPTTTLTNVTLPNGGNLIMDIPFQLSRNMLTAFTVNFGSTALTQSDATGDYIFTPILTGTISNDAPDVNIEGEITALSEEDQTINVVTVNGDEYTVRVLTTTTVIDNTVSRQNSDFGLLASGQIVGISGELTGQRSIRASEIRIEEIAPDTVAQGVIIAIDDVLRQIIIQTDTVQVRANESERTRVLIEAEPDILLSFEDLMIGQTVTVTGTEIDTLLIRALIIALGTDDELVVGEVVARNNVTRTYTVRTNIRDIPVRAFEGTIILDGMGNTLNFTDINIGDSIRVNGVTIADSIFAASNILEL